MEKCRSAGEKRNKMSMDCSVSIMVLGETEVGKTSLLHRFQKGTFSGYHVNTCISRFHKPINLMGKSVRVELWDTGGDPRFRNAVKGNYSKVDGVLLVFDVTDVASFHKLSSWLEEFRTINRKAIAILVGNKLDSPDVQTVSQIMIENFATKMGLEYFQTSAKTGNNVNNIFEYLIMKILKVEKVTQSSSSPESQNSISSSNSTNTVNPKPGTPSEQLISHKAEVHLNPSKSKTPNNSETITKSAHSSKGFKKSATNSTAPVQSATLSKKPTSANNCAKATAQSTVSSNRPLHSTNVYISSPVTLVNSSKEPTDTDSVDGLTQSEDDGDWCFPDVEYLNLKKQETSLPPVIPLPDDIIKLHIERFKQNGQSRRNQDDDNFCCQI